MGLLPGVYMTCVCVTRMSKRIREEGAPIPAWIAKSGVDEHALRQLLAWMGRERLGFVHTDGIYDHRGPQDHVVDLVVHDHDHGSMALCATCCPHCECCDETVPELYETSSADNPHDEACERCSRDTTCNHAEDDDYWPSYCDGCQRGCRDMDEKTVGGKEKVICERCHPEFFD